MESLALHHRDLGGHGKPMLVILHGLLGSSRNWQAAGRDLSAQFHVAALDLRNHGQSPHSAGQTFDLMVGDILRWLDEHQVSQASLLGHSLGGKVAMKLACSAPDRVRLLFVVDIAPRDYPPVSTALEGMMGLDLARLASRREAEDLLAGAVPERDARRFLVMNLERQKSGEFRWQVNLPALAAALMGLRASPLGPRDRFSGQTLFLLGERSTFVRKEDEAVIRAHFPRAEIAVIPDSGHYPHAENRPRFVEQVLAFARRS